MIFTFKYYAKGKYITFYVNLVDFWLEQAEKYTIFYIYTYY